MGKKWAGNHLHLRLALKLTMVSTGLILLMAAEELKDLHLFGECCKSVSESDKNQL